MHDQALRICSSFAFLEASRRVLVFSAFGPGVGVSVLKTLAAVLYS